MGDALPVPPRRGRARGAGHRARAGRRVRPGGGRAELPSRELRRHRHRAAGPDHGRVPDPPERAGQGPGADRRRPRRARAAGVPAAGEPRAHQRRAGSTTSRRSRGARWTPRSGSRGTARAGRTTGRVYAMYTREDPDESNDTNIWVRYSDDDGATWSTPQRINDDQGTNSQFLPRIALDQIDRERRRDVARLPQGQGPGPRRRHRRDPERRRPVLGHDEPGRRADLAARTSASRPARPTPSRRSTAWTTATTRRSPRTAACSTRRGPTTRTRPTPTPTAACRRFDVYTSKVTPPPLPDPNRPSRGDRLIAATSLAGTES